MQMYRYSIVKLSEVIRKKLKYINICTFNQIFGKVMRTYVKKKLFFLYFFIQLTEEDVQNKTKIVVISFIVDKKFLLSKKKFFNLQCNLLSTKKKKFFFFNFITVFVIHCVEYNKIQYNECVKNKKKQTNKQKLYRSPHSKVGAFSGLIGM